MKTDVSSAPGCDAVAAGGVPVPLPAVPSPAVPSPAGPAPVSAALAPASAVPSWLTAYLGVILSAVLAVGGLAVSAVFTDSINNSNGNTFTTGKVDLSTSPSSVVLSMPSMMPGDKVTAPVTVTNSGTVPLRYALKSTTTDNVLAAYLDFTIKSGVASCDNDGFASSGTVLYGPGDLGSTGGINVIGNPASGGQSGDRELAAGTNELLCMQVSLPFATSTSYQGLSTTATFDFAAEQTTNNP